MIHINYLKLEDYQKICLVKINLTNSKINNDNKIIFFLFIYIILIAISLNFLLFFKKNYF